MQSEKLKVQRMISEVFIFLCKIGAHNIDIAYHDYAEHFEVLIVSDFDDSKKGMVKVLRKYLCIARQEEMENYYWELAGHYQDDNVLTLVGMMTDDVEISLEEQKLKVKLIRKKHNCRQA